MKLSDRHNNPSLFHVMQQSKRYENLIGNLCADYFQIYWIQNNNFLFLKVDEGIELAAYESIPGNQRINLFEVLGDQVPQEVINNLQSQIDNIGRN